MNTNALRAEPERVGRHSEIFPGRNEIKQHPYLETLSPHTRRVLSDAARGVHFRAGEVIFSQSEPADRFFLIEKGKVALEGRIEGRGLVQIQELCDGEVLGWSWLFPPYFWHFGARALEPTEALFIQAAAIRTECEIDHGFGHELVNKMAMMVIERLQATRGLLMSRKTGKALL